MRTKAAEQRKVLLLSTPRYAPPRHVGWSFTSRFEKASLLVEGAALPASSFHTCPALCKRTCFSDCTGRHWASGGVRGMHVRAIALFGSTEN